MLPACLNEDWEADQSPSTFYDAVAYGGADDTNRLFGTRLETTTESECESSFDQIALLTENLGEDQFCAISRKVQENRSNDSCRRDRGGPLQYLESTNVDDVVHHNPVVIGLASLGGACSTKGKINVYTRIGSYIEWIESEVFD